MKGGRLKRSDMSRVKPDEDDEDEKKPVIVVPLVEVEEEEEEEPPPFPPPEGKAERKPDPLVPITLEDEASMPQKSVPTDPECLESFVVQLPTSLPSSLPRRETSRKRSDLDDVEPGPVGKLQKLQSGAVRLVLGDRTYDIHNGLHCSMLQQLVAVHDSKLVVLGEVRDKLLVTTRPAETWHDDFEDDDDD
mmetsp:Transcript_28806/g.92772  ORF Transcript_28806/g.92772 Transcript_28806/m.92772 type:complete len:191 (+) Transcript_28806:169-741(+)